MVELAGKQEDLGEMLRSLGELAHAATSAYDAAIERLENSQAKLIFDGFRRAHARHFRKLGLVVYELHSQAVASSSPAKLRHGAELIARLPDDTSVLLAMRSNESDINLAYEHALDRDDLDARLAHLLQDNLDEVRTHRNWIENQLAFLGEDHWDDDHHLEHFPNNGSSESGENKAVPRS